MSDLDKWRRRLSSIDAELLKLVAERHVLTERIGEFKRATGAATRDFAREKEVLDLARSQARQLGLSPDLAESLMSTLIRSSLTQQERARRQRRRAGRWPDGAGDRRRGQDGPLVRGLPRFAGLRRRNR